MKVDNLCLYRTYRPILVNNAARLMDSNDHVIRLQKL